MSELARPGRPSALSASAPTSAQPPSGIVLEPLRGAEATSAGAAAAVARQRQAQPNGWWGMLLFLCAEVTLFGGLIATYFYLDFGAARWPPPGVPRPSLLAPLLLTGALLTTSVPMALAASRAGRGARWSVVLLILLALAVQCAYVSYQLHLFVDELHKFPPQGSAYGSIYFTLLGVHHAHVIVGILLSGGLVLMLCVAGLSNYRLIGVRSVAFYWHVVNAIAVAVVLTQLSPSL